MDTVINPGTRKGRPNYSTDFKRLIAVAAYAANVSVSKLALAHEVKANMVFKWRRQYRTGLLGADAEPTFLPVTLRTAPEREPAAPEAATPADTGTIEIVIGDAVVRVHGAVNTKTLRGSRVSSQQRSRISSDIQTRAHALSAIEASSVET